MKGSKIVHAFLMMFLAGCSAIAGPAPSPTATLPPPTNTPEPTATMSPSPTVEASPTPLPPTETMAATPTQAPATLPATATLPPLPTQAPTQPPVTLPTSTRPPATPAGPTRTPSPTPITSEIVGVTWYWISLTKADGSKVTPDDPDKYYFILKSDGSVSAKGDCNTAAGTFKLRGQKLSIDFRSGTSNDCGSSSYSDLFISTLEDAAQFELNGNKLDIFLIGGGSMRFSK